MIKEAVFSKFSLEKKIRKDRR